ncbi:hypothetical protein SISNIDRAFT_492822 [Sistotremastrum niveocremeum HHB9708]|uniref:Uncharacterized protein n=2 Tax=Sistotremastraceae TaxID=3402574 RepID=A0A165A776_9AGAM|nr:hypothetical protein SISNIDRAFT_492822 [Sistotremastrum niveocremeum HHB9708]KZT43496.1 hypothetical protein SISSUDRAFT_1039923 [Sistotremastrum suecicum HHB10207 ss-3]
MSPPSSSQHTSSKRRVTREQLLGYLKILGPITNPLPATLPPSPPASRSASPVHHRKRKSDDSDSSASGSEPKRARLSSSDEIASPPTPRKQFPVKRPRRGKEAFVSKKDHLQEKYIEQGRLLKRSSEARVNAHLPPSNPAFVKIRNPPPPGSNYAVHARILTRLEALDSVLCFAFAQWQRELSTRPDEAWWSNSSAYFETARRSWKEVALSQDARDLALYNLFILVDAYWQNRMSYYILRYSVDPKVANLMNDYKQSPLTNKSPPSLNHGPANGNLQPTPPNTAPSPATLAVVGPASGGHTSASRSPNLQPPDRPVPFSEALTKAVQRGTSLMIKSNENFLHSSQRINLSILATHYPKTYARATQTTLHYHEEYEIDFEDDESELYLPLAPVKGEGLGWILAVGRSMLREYGAEFGYLGYAGALRPDNITWPNK